MDLTTLEVVHGNAHEARPLPVKSDKKRCPGNRAIANQERNEDDPMFMIVFIDPLHIRVLTEESQFFPSFQAVRDVPCTVIVSCPLCFVAFCCIFCRDTRYSCDSLKSTQLQ